MKRPEMVEFIVWLHEVDGDLVLDTFDVALGWFSAKGNTHDDALALADEARELIDVERIGRDRLSRLYGRFF